jgi:LacI family transcriptional regulator
MSTIKDVSRIAGVSLATVSRVINGASNISDKTRERVMEAIKSVGYKPNNLAKALVQRKTNTIGVVVNNLHDVFFHDLIKGFESGTNDTNYNLVFCSAYGNTYNNRFQYVRYLSQGVSDGIILYGSYFSDESLIKDLTASNTPFVLVDSDVAGNKVNSLLIDNVNGACSAVDYLISLGHRDIAFIAGDPNKKDLMDRMSGYTYAMQRRSLLIRDGYIQHTTRDYHTASDCMHNLLAIADRPTAVFCANDAIASFAIKAAMEDGFNVPRDISVIGFDNQSYLPDGYGGPLITTMSHPLFQLAVDSIDMLIEILNNPQTEPRTVLYPTEVVEKESTASLCRD